VYSLTRADAVDLQELKQVALQLVDAQLQLKREQNQLTKYIDMWMKRKHATLMGQA
jgi:hypothetical protein